MTQWSRASEFPPSKGGSHAPLSLGTFSLTLGKRRATKTAVNDGDFAPVAMMAHGGLDGASRGFALGKVPARPGCAHRSAYQ